MRIVMTSGHARGAEHAARDDGWDRVGHIGDIGRVASAQASAGADRYSALNNLPVGQ